MKTTVIHVFFKKIHYMKNKLRWLGFNRFLNELSIAIEIYKINKITIYKIIHSGSVYFKNLLNTI